MEMESCIPPGFRFHPTEEELVGYYLKRKVNSLKIDLDVIIDLDLYRMEPWDMQDRCNLGYEEQNEWYFFSHKDRKYPTGRRTNRATAAGFWKATGRDKAVLSKEKIIGMRKTLVFYRGRAPNGRKTDWIMHEYRLQTSEHGPPQEEGWVVCRAFKKPCPNHRQGFEAWNNAYNIRDNGNLRQLHLDVLNPMHDAVYPDKYTNSHQSFASDQEFVSTNTQFDNQLVELPQLDSPTISTSFATKEGFECNGAAIDQNKDCKFRTHDGQCVDWKNLDNILASQLIGPSASLLTPELPMISSKYDLDHVQIQANHFVGYFPNF